MIQSIPKLSVKLGYRPQSEDKTPEADAIDFYLLRQLTNQERWQTSASLTRWAKAVSLRGMRKASQSTFRERFAQSVLGSKGSATQSNQPELNSIRLLYPFINLIAECLRADD
jgi:hypothetical protein